MSDKMLNLVANNMDLAIRVGWLADEHAGATGRFTADSAAMLL